MPDWRAAVVSAEMYEIYLVDLAELDRHNSVEGALATSLMRKRASQCSSAAPHPDCLGQRYPGESQTCGTA